MSAPEQRNLIRLRRELHNLAEPSGRESGTAAFVTAQLKACGGNVVLTGLGGHGVAAIFADDGDGAGPTVVLRAELDALPCAETTGNPAAHRCGHDGHMAILLGVAGRLAAEPPRQGRVALLFQPAEETGAGAARVVADPRWPDLAPDWIFALHNLPGYARGTVLVREGAFCAGSAGLSVTLRGAPSHAAYPDQGRSPDTAMTELVTGLVALPIPCEQRGELALVTITHARLGKPGFGTTPGEAHVQATLRADDDVVLAGLRTAAVSLAAAVADRHGLTCTTTWCEEFPAVVNDQQAVAHVRSAARAAGLTVTRPRESPFRWSEDFGTLMTRTRGALCGLGAGLDHAPLHARQYTFDDELLTPGVALLTHLARALTGPA